MYIRVIYHNSIQLIYHKGYIRRDLSQLSQSIIVTVYMRWLVRVCAIPINPDQQFVYCKFMS